MTRLAELEMRKDPACSAIIINSAVLFNWFRLSCVYRNNFYIFYFLQVFMICSCFVLEKLPFEVPVPGAAGESQTKPFLIVLALASMYAVF